MFYILHTKNIKTLYGGFHSRGCIPKWMVFVGENPTKIDQHLSPTLYDHCAKCLFLRHGVLMAIWLFTTFVEYHGHFGLVGGKTHLFSC